VNNTQKMSLGYVVGGLLVLALAPSIIWLFSAVIDSIYRIEIVPNQALRIILIIVLLIPGLIFGIWSVIIQNIVGEGGPVEIASIEISPKTKKLVTSGPYKYTRNPMLLGTFLMYLSFAVFINSMTAILIVILIFIFMLVTVVPMEEKRLIKDFGLKYKEYRNKVSMFIPWFQRKD
jgi:protein-S-isoprenylcysteine O-methyltransferase Ste14